MFVKKRQISICNMKYTTVYRLDSKSKKSTKMAANGQGSHFSALTKLQDFIRNSRYNFLFFFNVASTYNRVSVYTLFITSTPFCLHYPKVCIPPLTATHNDLYHFERWVLIKKKTEINDLMAAK